MCVCIYDHVYMIQFWDYYKKKLDKPNNHMYRNLTLENFNTNLINQ